MSIELKRGEYPVEVVQRALRIGLEKLDDTIEEIAENNHPALIKKIREICEPIIEEMVTYYLEELKADRGIWSSGAEALTNANLVTRHVMDEQNDRLWEFWDNTKDELEKKGFSESDYWKCIEWIPTYHIGRLRKYYLLPKVSKIESI